MVTTTSKDTKASRHLVGFAYDNGFTCHLQRDARTNTWSHHILRTQERSLRDIRRLVAQYPTVRVDFADEDSVIGTADDETSLRALYAEAQRSGFACAFSVNTTYSYSDALSADLGMVVVGPTNIDHFPATIPKDAFDFSTGCPVCGLGAKQVKAHVFGAAAAKCKANFDSNHGRVFMRSEIAREIMKVTGRSDCMLHPTTRSGQIVKEWMAAVPTATMPSLGPKSEGILLGATTSMSSVGEGPQEQPPCPECGRKVWAPSYQHPTRLVYPKKAIAMAQKHGVVEMYEPRDLFPTFNRKKRVFKDLYGLPELLFSRAAIEVLMKYMQTEHIRDSAWIQPVYAE